MSTLTLRRGASNGGELRIVLDRSEALNAVDRELGAALRDALQTAATDPEVRVVVLTGAGRAFSSGADLRAGFDVDANGHPALQESLDTVYHPAIEAIREMEKPVVAAVNGPAVGVGCSLALACDLVVAAESAYLLLAFVNIGLAPDGGASLLVPARAGFARAAEMALLGERVPARRALESRLQQELAATEDFGEGVQAFLGRRNARFQGR